MFKLQFMWIHVDLTFLSEDSVTPAKGITRLLQMNTADLLIKYTDLHLSALITARGFPVLGYSVESWDTFFFMCEG